MIHETRKDIAVTKVVRDEGAISPEQFARLDHIAAEYVHRYRLWCRGEWEVSATTYMVVSDYPRTLLFPFAQVRDQMEAQHPGKYDEHTYWMLVGGGTGQHLGEARTGYNRIGNWAETEHVALHEGGHAFGMGHETGQGNEYGGIGWMAHAFAAPCAHHESRLGILKEGEFADLTDSAGLHLVPLETLSLNPGEHRAARIEVIDGHEAYRYWFETRLMQIQSILGVSNLFSPGDVFIHRPEVRWHSPESVYLGRVSVGGEMELPGGVTVRNEGFDGVSSRVSIEVNGRPAEFTDLPTVDPAPGGEPEESHSGLWWNPQYPREGFDFTIRGNQFIGYWYGYGPDGGRKWMILDGRVQGDHITFDAISCPNGNQVQEGGGWLSFDGDKAELLIESQMYGREHFTLDRLSPPKSDPLLASAGNLRGISIATYHGNRVGHWYGPEGWYLLDGSDALQIDSRHHDETEVEPERVGSVRIEGNRMTLLDREYGLTPL